MQRDDPGAATDVIRRLMERIHASDVPPRSASADSARGFGWMQFGLAASVAAAVCALLWWGTISPSAPPHFCPCFRGRRVSISSTSMSSWMHQKSPASPLCIWTSIDCGNIL
jgi:hypothetical protein